MLPYYYNIPAVSILLCMISGISIPLLSSGRRAYRLTLFVSATVTLLSALLMYKVIPLNEYFTYMMGHFPAPWGNELSAGPLEAMMGFIFGLVMFLSLLGGSMTLFHDILPGKQKFYFTMMNMLMAALLAMTYTNDLFTGYVFIEISTIAACAIVVARDTPKTIGSTIRYLAISLLGSGLFLIGVVLLYCITGHLLMPNIQTQVLRLVSTGLYTVPLTVVAGLLFAGIAIKSALFPFGAWLPMAHGGATTTSSAVLSGLVLKGYIVMLIKIFYRVFTIDVIRDLNVTNIMFACGLAGMIYGSIEAFREEHIKRMLAHSSMAQIGYIFMGIGLDVNLGVAAAFLQIMVHAFVKPLLFLCAGRLSEVYNHEKSSYRLRGSAHKDPIAGIGFTIGAMSMVGIPLLGGFAAKFYLVTSAMMNPAKLWPALITLMISAVMNALYYMPEVIAIWTRCELCTPNPVDPNPGFDYISAPVLSAGVLFLGLNGYTMIQVIQRGLALL